MNREFSIEIRWLSFIFNFFVWILLNTMDKILFQKSKSWFIYHNQFNKRCISTISQPNKKLQKSLSIELPIIRIWKNQRNIVNDSFLPKNVSRIPSSPKLVFRYIIDSSLSTTNLKNERLDSYILQKRILNWNCGKALSHYLLYLWWDTPIFWVR